jgi:hypothetical protein
MSDLLFYALKDLLERSKTDEEAQFDFHSLRAKHGISAIAFLNEGIKRGVFV